MDIDAKVMEIIGNPSRIKLRGRLFEAEERFRVQLVTSGKWQVGMLAVRPAATWLQLSSVPETIAFRSPKRSRELRKDLEEHVFSWFSYGFSMVLTWF